nr:MAG TPA: internal virion protein D [Caudoviricetes sp.]
MPIPNTYSKGYFADAPQDTDTYIQQVDDEVGFIEGIKRSPLGNYFREAGLTGSFDAEDSTYVPSHEEIMEIGQAVNWNDTAIKHILNKVTKPEDIKPLIENYKDNVHYANSVAKAGLVDSISSSFGNMLGNPVDLLTIPVAAGATVPKAILTGALMSMGSAVAEEEGTGIEQEITYNTVLGGATLGGLVGATQFIRGMRGVSDALEETASKSDLINNALYNAGGKVSMGVKEVAKVIQDNTPDAIKEVASDTLTKIKNANPFWSLEGAYDEVIKNRATKDMLDMVFISQKGRKTATGYAQAKEGFQTVEEVIRDDEIHLRRIADKAQGTLRKLQELYDDPEGLRQAMFDALEGKMPSNSQLHRVEGFDNLITDMRGYIDSQLVKLRNAGVEVGDFGKTYFPFRTDWNRAKRWMSELFPDVKDYGTAKKLLADKVKNLLLKSLDNPEDRERLKEFWMNNLKAQGKDTTKVTDKQFVEWAKKQAGKDAYGYVDQSKSVNANGEDVTFLASYQHQRTPWNHRYEDKDGWRVDQLRADPIQTLMAYGRKTTGDIIASSMFGAQADAKGSIRQALKEILKGYSKSEADSVKPALRDSQEKATQRVMDTVERAIYRTTERDTDEARGVLSAISDIARNLSFFTANGYMGILNLTEQAEAIKAYGGTFFIKSIPGLAGKFSSWSKGNYTPEWRRSFMNMLFGYETRGLRLWDETLARAEYKYGEGSLSAKLVAGTAQLAEWSPLTRFLNATQESIARTAQDEFLGEYLRYLYKASPLDDPKGWAKGFINKTTLRRAGVSMDDFKYLGETMRKTFEPNSLVDVSKGFQVTNHMALLNDPRAMFTLRRLGNYVASECIQRNSLANTMLWQGSKASPLLGLLFQFKSFALASWNNRFIKSINRFKEGDAIGQLQTHSISTALAGLGVIAQSSTKTAGMSEEDRKKWWKRNYGVEALDEADYGTLFRFLMNAGLRSGMYAAISLPLSPFIGGDLKSTTTPRAKTGEFEPFSIENIVDFFPSARVLNSVLRTPADMANIMRYKYLEGEGTYSDAEIDKNLKRAQKALVRDFLAVIPNVDYLKNQLKETAYEHIDNR